MMRKGFVTVSSLLRYVILATMALIGLIGFMQYGMGALIFANWQTYIILLVFCILLYGMAIPSRNRINFAIRMSVVLMLIMSVLWRFVSIMVVPKTFGGVMLLLNGGNQLHLNEFNIAIVMMFSYIVFLMLGAYLGGKICYKFSSNKIPSKRIRSHGLCYTYKRPIILAAYLFGIAATVLTLLMGWKMGTHWSMGWIIRLLPASLFFNLVLFMYIYYKAELRKNDKILIIGLIVIYIVSTLAQGSRSALFQLIVLISVAVFFAYGNLRIGKRKIVTVGVFIVLFAPMVWVLGTTIRAGHMSLEQAISQTNILDVALHIVYRLGSDVDDFIITMSGWLDTQATNQYMTTINILAAAINGFVPGKVLHAPFESMGNLWLTLVWGEELGSRVNGHTWFLFSQLYLLYGYIGSLILTFLWGLLGSAMIKMLWDRHTFFTLWLAYQLCMVMFVSVVFGANMDSIIRTILYFATYNLVLFIVLLLLPRRIKSKRQALYSSGDLPT